MSAVLVSELAVSELQMPVKSLDDVVNKGEWSLCVRNDSFVYEILVVSKPSVLQFILYTTVITIAKQIHTRSLN